MFSPLAPGSLEKRDERLSRLNDDIDASKKMRRQARERNYSSMMALKGLQGRTSPLPPPPRHTPSPNPSQSWLWVGTSDSASSSSSSSSSASSDGDVMAVGELRDTEVQFRSHGNTRKARLGSVLVHRPPPPPSPPSSASILQKLYLDELASSGSSTPNLAQTIRTSTLDVPPPPAAPVSIDISIKHKVRGASDGMKRQQKYYTTFLHN